MNRTVPFRNQIGLAIFIFKNNGTITNKKLNILISIDWSYYNHLIQPNIHNKLISNIQILQNLY